MPEVILPGTYVTVRDEGLIAAGRIATGYVGIVGTAARGPVDKPVILGSFSEARNVFGEPDAWTGGQGDELTLVRALELVFNNGGSTVYAVRAAAGGDAEGAAAPAAYAAKKGPSTVLGLRARTPGTWGNGIGVQVTSDTASPLRTLTLTMGTLREVFSGDNGGQLAAAVNAGSRLVEAVLGDAQAAVVPDAVASARLSGGANGEAAGPDDYERALAELENETINLVLLAGQDVGLAEVLSGHLTRTAQIKRERIGLIGAASDDVDVIAGHSLASDRMVFVAPGLVTTVVDAETRRPQEVTLPSGYTAAAVAGLISSLPVQSSPTNKTLSVGGLSTAYTSSRLEKLVGSRVLVVEKREGFRIVKGITTATNPAWHQITTRRIVDYATYGVRSACNPYIGKLNNTRVRGAMKATIDGFLTRMVEDEALVGYELEVSATRAQEIRGEAQVTMTLQPTFSIDFIMVTMYLS